MQSCVRQEAQQSTHICASTQIGIIKHLVVRPIQQIKGMAHNLSRNGLLRWHLRIRRMLLLGMLCKKTPASESATTAASASSALLRTYTRGPVGMQVKVSCVRAERRQNCPTSDTPSGNANSTPSPMKRATISAAKINAMKCSMASICAAHRCQAVCHSMKSIRPGKQAHVLPSSQGLMPHRSDGGLCAVITKTAL